jgi:hypothetical protein
VPYIPRNTRGAFMVAIQRIALLVRIASAGEFNFIITRLLTAWLGEHPTYGRFNEAIGVLECAKLELYRRMVAPYEDGKAAINGDVYPASADTEARARGNA